MECSIALQGCPCQIRIGLHTTTYVLEILGIRITLFRKLKTSCPMFSKQLHHAGQEDVLWNAVKRSPDSLDDIDEPAQKRKSGIRKRQSRWLLHSITLKLHKLETRFYQFLSTTSLNLSFKILFLDCASIRLIGQENMQWRKVVDVQYLNMKLSDVG